MLFKNGGRLSREGGKGEVWKQERFRWRLRWRTRRLIVLVVSIVFCICACKYVVPIVEKERGTGQEGERKDGGVAEVEKQNGQMDSGEEEFMDLCADIYETAGKEDEMDDWEVARDIVERFGECGYAAIDQDNQVDMTGAARVLAFCEKVEAGEQGELTIVEVMDSGGLVKFDLKTKDGIVDVRRTFYQYTCADSGNRFAQDWIDGNLEGAGSGKMQKTSSSSYRADDWKYTKEGYLMFSGAWFSEESYMLTMSDAKEHAAFRVLPLDERCRELNRNYLLPISYERNNMFLVDWSEEDFGELNFYDLYDILYPKVNKKPLPYEVDDNVGTGTIYRLPAEEFEQVVGTCFVIDGGTLRSKTSYLVEEKAYEYRSRGRYEAEYPAHPYPEVVAYEERGDGTIMLTVHAVFPAKGTSKAYVHEVVVRPTEDGGVQYVSNHVIHSKEDYEKTWHKPRLTVEERERLEKGYGFPSGEAEERERLEKGYGFLSGEAEERERLEKGYGFPSGEAEERERLEKGYDLPVTEEEKQEAKRDLEKMMELAGKADLSAGGENVYGRIISDEAMLSMKARIASQNVSVMDALRYSVMEHYQELEAFLLDCELGKRGTAVLYKVCRDGAIVRQKFYYDGSDMYVLSACSAGDAKGAVKVSGITCTRMEEWNYTKKGWFCYKMCVPKPPEVTEIVDGSGLVRVRPLSGECREWSEKCVLPLGYQGNNLLCSNWDAENMAGLDYNGVYEYFYQMKYGKRYDTDSGGEYAGEGVDLPGENAGNVDFAEGNKTRRWIPAAEFEALMTEYLPVGVAQLREWAAYDEEKQAYAWARLGCMNFSLTPFSTSLPEVVCVEENGDGTVTLTVDAVCDMGLCDDALITHRLTVRRKEGGGFLYLGNQILGGEERIPGYQYRVK